MFESIRNDSKSRTLGAYELKPRDVKQDLVMCEQLLQQQKRKGFLHRIMSNDEKWIHYNNPKCRRSWGKASHASTSMAKPNIHGLKHLLCIWWDLLDVVYYAAQTNWNHHGKSLSTTIDVFESSIEEKNGCYTNRGATKWFCNMTTWGHVLQNGLKPSWKHLMGSPTPTAVFTRHCPDWLSLVLIGGQAEQHFHSYEDAKKWVNLWLASKDFFYMEFKCCQKGEKK